MRDSSKYRVIHEGIVDRYTGVIEIYIVVDGESRSIRTDIDEK